MDRTGAGNSTDDLTKRILYRAYYGKCVEPRPFGFMILEIKERSGGFCVPEVRASSLRDSMLAASYIRG